MQVHRLIRPILLYLALNFIGSTYAEMQTSPNSYSGLNHYRAELVFPKFDSIKIIGTHIGIDSRADEAINPAQRQRAKKFEKQVIEHFSAALHKETEMVMSSTLGLPLVDEYNATTLVMRPSVSDFEIGHSGKKLYSVPDEIILSIEVFDVIGGGLLAMASTKTMIPREQLFYEFGMKKAKAKKASEQIANVLSEMLIAMFKDIEAGKLKE